MFVEPVWNLFKRQSHIFKADFLADDIERHWWDSGDAWPAKRGSALFHSPHTGVKQRSAGGFGEIFSNSMVTRLATTHFSLQVLTNIKYFCRLSKNRKFVWPSASGVLAAGAVWHRYAHGRK
jgi:hypothetical protein